MSRRRTGHAIQGWAVLPCTFALLPGAGRAAAQCGGSAGDCCNAHAGPACDDAACCGSVCFQDPYCCLHEWDALCATLAVQVCGACDPPVNDACAGALPMGFPQTPYTTVDARTAGVQHAGALDLYCTGWTFLADVWFVYTAAQSGATSVTATGVDPVVALYSGASCGGASLIACRAEGFLGPATVNFSAQQGASYLVRVGSTSGRTGPGVLTIAGPAFGCGAGSCFAPHPWPGCADPTCCEPTCQQDPFCCTVAWDEICVDNIACLAVDCACPFSDAMGDCCQPQPGTGCQDLDCCDAVAAVDSACAFEQWDETCAELARHLCPGECPPACVADITGDGQVTTEDLVALIVDWGGCRKNPCTPDLNFDGTVGVADLVLLILTWGPC
jgi:hypothetical protein